MIIHFLRSHQQFPVRCLAGVDLLRAWRPLLSNFVNYSHALSAVRFLTVIGSIYLNHVADDLFAATNDTSYRHLHFVLAASDSMYFSNECCAVKLPIWLVRESILGLVEIYGCTAG